MLTNFTENAQIFQFTNMKFLSMQVENSTFCAVQTCDLINKSHSLVIDTIIMKISTIELTLVHNNTTET